MTSPRRLLVPFLIVFALALSACTPSETPPPTSTPTLTTDDPETGVGGVEAGAELNDEQRAFEEAKAAFEAYLEAQSRLRTDEPETLKDLLETTSGDLRESNGTRFVEMREKGFEITGSTSATYVEAVGSNNMRTEVTLDVCQDVSNYLLSDANGDPIVDELAPAVLALKATVKRDPQDRKWRVSYVEARTGGRTC